ncbi:hypothetical protein FHL15_010541 [Xylaria flabelliformis]|uniref:Uncharacterized protein n=1 Tax=Xylaria flabelliformis TaxID=2512241 RepID=A0A553HKW8_9PEZI|nr:hypothetical protein FHL15_010541 [Xylaria flabelliformis]
MQIMGPSLSTEPATPTDPCGINATPRFALLSLHTAQPTCSISKTPQSKRTAAGVPCPTRRLQPNTHSTSFVTQTVCSSSVTPMTRPRPSDSVRAIIESAIPNTRIEAISTISTKRPLRTFKVQLTDERVLLLNLPPPSSRLLRSEQSLLQSEAAVVGWLQNDICQRSKEARPLNKRSPVKSPQEEGSLGRWTSSKGLSAYGDQLIRFLPNLITHSSTSSETGPAFSLVEPTLGDTISSLGKILTPAERTSVDFQKGHLMRRIANITSPNGKFGPPVMVLEQPHTTGDTQKTTRDTKVEFDGTDSWKKTFHLLLEGILRDGEDMAVTISYELVRANFQKFGHLLDAVKTPRLVICDAGEDDVVLVWRPKGVAKERKQEETESPKRSPKVKLEPGESSGGASVDDDDESSSTIEVTGLRDWSNCIFGDPLFATVFSHATPEFEQGFRRQPHDESDVMKKEEDDVKSSGGSKDDVVVDEQKQDVDIIEDPENAPTRILLYECYHATVSIVRQLYRPDTDSSAREIAARRRLVAALAKLEHVGGGESAGKRPRRLSRDEWPVKRPRGDTPK